jgi:hypothetical protein
MFMLVAWDIDRGDEELACGQGRRLCTRAAGWERESLCLNSEREVIP